MSDWGERKAPGSGDTIFALSTPPGRSAVAVIRLSGPRSGEALRALTGRNLTPRRATFAQFRDPVSGAPLDEGLALFFPAPASFTGEDCGEIQGHGSLAAISAVLRALSALEGLRTAEPGEFTRRALRNGKLDLDRVEALADLIDAQTDQQRKLALQIPDKGPATLAAAWRETMLDSLAEIDARLDFSDESDVDALENEALAGRLMAFGQDVRAQMAASERASRIRQGFVVALCGPPNAGKSTLLNALVGREQAIVSPHAGTTRDTIEVALDLNGLLVTIVDTAGIRETADPVEAIGVDRARSAAERANFTIWLDAPDASADPDMKVDLRVWSKADVCAAPEHDFRISARSGENVERLLNLIAEQALGASVEGSEIGVLRERHFDLAHAIAGDIDAAAALVRQDRLEVAAAHLRGALVSVAALGSKSSDEDVLDRIFGRFCIGK